MSDNFPDLRVHSVPAGAGPGGQHESPARLTILLGPGGTARTEAVLIGELDAASAPELRRALIAALEAGDGLDLDLRDVTGCDGAGLNALLELRNRAMAAHRTLTVTAASDTVLRLLDLTGHRGALTPSRPSARRLGADVRRLHAAVCLALLDAGLPLARHDAGEDHPVVEAGPRGVVVRWDTLPGTGTPAHPPAGAHRRPLHRAVLDALAFAGFRTVEDSTATREIIVSALPERTRR
ncbi:STAS domain-containing protein [Streptomyces sp. ME01-24h]|nr:STAS domain-containing protein [Streptomyces sp. ME19-03-3]MDX3353937.1 STAS domain-containing protein [Streptomyces sp. ME01-24h]